MEILVIYETIEGQTRKIVEFAAARMRAAGHGVRLVDADDTSVTPSFDGVDKVVLVAPVHERRHPKNFEVLVAASRADLKAHDTMMISIGLKAAFPDGMDEAQDYLTEMKMRTGFDPDVEVLAAGAVRSESYGYYESQIVKHVVLSGRHVDLVDGVHEFTDWNALGDKIDVFLQAASRQTA